MICMLLCVFATVWDCSCPRSHYARPAQVLGSPVTKARLAELPTCLRPFPTCPKFPFAACLRPCCMHVLPSPGSSSVLALRMSFSMATRPTPGLMPGSGSSLVLLRLVCPEHTCTHKLPLRIPSLSQVSRFLSQRLHLSISVKRLRP